MFELGGGRWARNLRAWNGRLLISYSGYVVLGMGAGRGGGGGGSIAYQQE